ncbi:hypothetical protein OAO18_06325 [Francisellaceae bacterium]|nr:hypothetical protein [Francisellaceae bacterium]
MLKKKIISALVGMSLFGLVESANAFDPAPLEKTVNKSIIAAIPQPYSFIASFSESFISGFKKPTASSDQIYSLEQTIESQILLLQQEMTEVLVLEEDTIDLIVAVDKSSEMSDLNGKVIDIYSSARISDSRDIYTSLYRSAQIFPVSQNESFFQYVSDLYNKGDDQDNKLETAFNILTGDDNLDNIYLQNIINNFNLTLSTTYEGWGILDKYYSNYINANDFENEGLNYDFVAKYLNATSNIVALQQAYYENLTILYNLQAFQVAMYFVDPERFKDSDGKFIEGFAYKFNEIEFLSTSKGEEGFNESMQNLTRLYIETNLSADGDSSIVSIFGGYGITINDNQVTIDNDAVQAPVLTSLSPMNAYISDKIQNDTTQLFSIVKNDIFPVEGKGLLGIYNTQKQTFLNNCQILSASFPNKIGLAKFKYNCTVEVDI